MPKWRPLRTCLRAPPRPNYLSLLRNTAPSSRILPRFPGLCDRPNRRSTTETILPGTSSDQGLRISWGVFGGTVVSARHGKQRVFSARPQDNKARQQGPLFHGDVIGLGESKLDALLGPVERQARIAHQLAGRE